MVVYARDKRFRGAFENWVMDKLHTNEQEWRSTVIMLSVAVYNRTYIQSNQIINDAGLYDTYYIVSSILRYQLIPNCYPQHFLLSYNDASS